MQIVIDWSVMEHDPLYYGEMFANRKSTKTQEDDRMVSHIMKGKPRDEDEINRVRGEIAGNKYAIENLLLAMASLEQGTSKWKTAKRRYEEALTASMFFNFTGGVPLRNATNEQFITIMDAMESQLRSVAAKERGEKSETRLMCELFLKNAVVLKEGRKK